jgi:hypothetical protein
MNVKREYPLCQEDMAVLNRYKTPHEINPSHRDIIDLGIVMGYVESLGINQTEKGFCEKAKLTNLGKKVIKENF